MTNHVIAVGSRGYNSSRHIRVNPEGRIYLHGNVKLLSNLVHLYEGWFKILINSAIAFKIGCSELFHGCSVVGLVMKLKFNYP